MLKKIFKILGIIFGIIVVLYLISILLLRSKNPIKESVFFTPTKYDNKNIFNQLDSKYLTNLSKDSVSFAANKFIDTKIVDSIKLNYTEIKRNYKQFSSNSNSEYYTITPKSYDKVGIFMLGNQFNVFNLFDNLTELSKRDNIKIYVITYTGNGYSDGKSSFENQFTINQNFYNYIESKEKINYIFGHSLGTVFATKLAVDNKIANLVLLAPASNFDDLVDYFKSQTNILIRPYFNTSELKNSGIVNLGNTSENIKNYNGNLLLLHGTKDSNLPFYMSEKILANCPTKTKKLVPLKNGDHYAPFVKNNWAELIKNVK